VRALALTHGDSDLIGFAARLYRETGVSAYIHEADADRAIRLIRDAAQSRT
jgi:glyoxylase-like metal-dependent hydrolase (beta-lactamase superfamily II)